jgi:hypothetical protein
MQEHVQNIHEGGIVAPILLHSDKTSLSNDRKITGHPLYLTIGNIACEDRYLPEGHCLLAIFPDFNIAGSEHLQRLSSFQMCLSHILEPLKEASRE